MEFDIDNEWFNTWHEHKIMLSSKLEDQLCMNADEVNLREELELYLKSFEYFTDIVGSSSPTLSLIPLIKHKIGKFCVSHDQESAAMKQVKAVLANLDFRFADLQVVIFYKLLDSSTNGLTLRMKTA